jgi:hypothetical protein
MCGTASQFAELAHGLDGQCVLWQLCWVVLCHGEIELCSSMQSAAQSQQCNAWQYLCQVCECKLLPLPQLVPGWTTHPDGTHYVP